MGMRHYADIQVYLTSDDIKKLEPELFEKFIDILDVNDTDWEYVVNYLYEDNDTISEEIKSAYDNLKQALLNNHNIDTTLFYHEDEEGISDIQGEYWYVFDGLVQNPLISKNVEVKLGTTVTFG